MAKLTNTPAQATVFELEARKSFAFSVVVVDGADVVSELAGSSLTFSMGLFDPSTLVPELVLETTAVGGVFHLQAADLDLPARDYQFVITWRFAGYSLAIVKGEVRLRDNAEFASTGHQYGGGEPEQELLVTLAGKNVLRVEARGGASTGGGELDATGVDAGRVPTAQGDGTWSWAETADDFEIDGGPTDTVEVTITGDKDVGLTVTAEVTDAVATKQYVDAPYGHLPRVGSELSRTLGAFVSGTSTTLFVSVLKGGLWTTDPADLPMDIVVDGVILRVTEISGESSPQTMTVEQEPVNGVVKTISSGSFVQVR